MSYPLCDANFASRQISQRSRIAAMLFKYRIRREFAHPVRNRVETCKSVLSFSSIQMTACLIV